MSIPSVVRGLLGVATITLLVIGCGDDGGTGAGTAGAGGADDGSIVEPGAPTYQEAAEATNGEVDGEPTGLTLGDDGLVIEGSFESSAMTSDAYQFNTGTWGGATEPDFPGIDVYVFIDGKRYDSSQSATHLTLDTVVDDGFSTLSGGAFMNAAVTSGTDYNLGLSGSAGFAGKAYRIEVRGHTP